MQLTLKSSLYNLLFVSLCALSNSDLPIRKTRVGGIESRLANEPVLDFTCDVTIGHSMAVPS